VKRFGLAEGQRESFANRLVDERGVGPRLSILVYLRSWRRWRFPDGRGTCAGLGRRSLRPARRQGRKVRDLAATRGRPTRRRGRGRSAGSTPNGRRFRGWEPCRRRGTGRLLSMRNRRRDVRRAQHRRRVPARRWIGARRQGRQKLRGSSVELVGSHGQACLGSGIDGPFQPNDGVILLPLFPEGGAGRQPPRYVFRVAGVRGGKRGEHDGHTIP
jgi:hypothetical protein